jgi:nitrate/nitrite transporter NarK
LANLGGYAFVFWLPTTIRRTSGLSVYISTACAALPFLVAVLTVLISGRDSDRTGERRLHASVPLILAGAFFSLSTLPGQPFPLVMLWLTLTGAAGYAFPPPFWVLPTLTLGESAAAASIGLINSIGNLGGFFGPSIVGYLLSRNYSYGLAMTFLASCYLSGGLLILAIRIRPKAL